MSTPVSATQLETIPFKFSIPTHDTWALWTSPSSGDITI